MWISLGNLRMCLIFISYWFNNWNVGKKITHEWNIDEKIYIAANSFCVAKPIILKVILIDLLDITLICMILRFLSKKPQFLVSNVISSRITLISLKKYSILKTSSQSKMRRRKSQWKFLRKKKHIQYWYVYYI